MSLFGGILLSSGLGVDVGILGMGSTFTTLTGVVLVTPELLSDEFKTFPIEKSIGSPVPPPLVLFEDEDDLEIEDEAISE